MNILGIDPGPVETAYCCYENSVPGKFGKINNGEFLTILPDIIQNMDMVVIEMIASYGMPVGKTTFETCIFIGCIYQKLYDLKAKDIRFLTRKNVKMEICFSVKAKDSNVRQAIIDIYGGKDKGIGAKKCKNCKGKGWSGRDRAECSNCEGSGWEIKPGPLNGISNDVWAALAVAIATERIIEIEHKQKGAGVIFNGKFYTLEGEWILKD